MTRGPLAIKSVLQEETNKEGGEKEKKKNFNFKCSLISNIFKYPSFPALCSENTFCGIEIC